MQNKSIQQNHNSQIKENTINSVSQNRQTVKKQKKITNAQAYFQAIQDQYDPISNPSGFVIYGVSINRRLMEKVLQYLPNFLTIKDLQYSNFGGNKRFNQFIAKITNVYNQHQTMSVHNLTCILDLFAGNYKTFSLEGDNNFVNLQAIVSYSGSKIVDQKESACNFIFVSQSRATEVFQKVKDAQKPTILILSDLKLLQKIDNQNVFVCYQVQINKIISFGVVHNSNPDILEEFGELFDLHPISTLTQAAALAKIQPNDDQNLQESENNLNQEIIQMIKNIDNIQIQPENIYLFNGASGILAFVAKVFFSQGDTVTLDCPIYSEVESDFQTKVSLKFQHVNMFKSTLLRRVQRAKEDGSKGFVIVNANNPTGYVYSEQQIREVGEWAANNPDFTLIFDEMYIKLIHGDKKSLSSTQFSCKLPNVHTIRGFAKQFGLCGIKVGYLITSNKKAIDFYNKCKQILVPHKYSMLTVLNVLKKSSHGQQILFAGVSMAQQAIKTTCAELDKYNIKYMKPSAGVFVFVDLRNYLKENIHLNEYMLFKRIFYDYRVNVACGQDYRTQEPGWFRICAVKDEQSIRQGIRRLSLMLKDQPLN